MSATTVSIPITIRNEVCECKLPAVSGGTFYHGSYVALDGTGYLKNFVTTLTGITMVGILKDDKFEDQALGSTANPMSTPGVMVATAAGSLANNTNCLNVYTYGEFLGAFESGTGLAVTDEGCAVYVVDNQTLTVNPSLGCVQIGRLTKYISATAGYVQLDAWNTKGMDLIKIHQALPAGASSAVTLNQVVCQANPFAFPVIVRGLDVYIKTGGGAVAGTAFIAPTTSGLAATTMIFSSSTINWNSSGVCFTIMKNGAFSSSTIDLGSDAAYWATSAYLAITEASTVTTALVGWWAVTVQRV